ncbi:hypothetical protein [Mycoplasmopsis fermentans]|uniref:hypothetical protein n=2 Tax=Mycoplasmopsis fermentans TaxID=2115 RepID=UPI001604A3DA|nr:hypothetical protein [Mycoplasmopsis fermentans]
MNIRRIPIIPWRQWRMINHWFWNPTNVSDRYVIHLYWVRVGERHYLLTLSIKPCKPLQKSFVTTGVN